LRGLWKKWLYEGVQENQRKQIEELMRGVGKEEALKKWESYFEGNKERMQYSGFKEKKVICD
jgi:hypothetical protein